MILRFFYLVNKVAQLLPPGLINFITIVGYIPTGNRLWYFSPQSKKLGLMKIEPADLKLTLSENIKKHRKKQGLSQEKLALLAGVDRSYMSEVERCLANPSIDAILRISNALQIYPAELFEMG